MSHRQIVILLIVSLTIICGSYLLTDRTGSSLAGPAKVSIDLEDAHPMTGIKSTDEQIEQALQLGTRDARLYYHAGMIAQAQGRLAEAEQLLNEALAINPAWVTMASAR